MIQEKNGIVSFTLFKVERGREKICRCNPPHYIIDEVNRIVTCEDCGATIDPIEALLTLCNYTKNLEEYQSEAIEKINAYRKMADEEWKRRMKNRVFKEMDKYYQQELYPVCPECSKQFDPIKISQWQRKSPDQPK